MNRAHRNLLHPIFIKTALASIPHDGNWHIDWCFCALIHLCHSESTGGLGFEDVDETENACKRVDPGLSHGSSRSKHNE